VFAQLSLAHVTFITRAKTNLKYTVERSLVRRGAVHDTLIWVGPAEQRQLLRLVEVLYRGTWDRYLSNELDAQRLPTAYLVALYWQRWRIEDAYAIVKRLLVCLPMRDVVRVQIEDAYAIVKRLLGLAYFWCGAQNAVELQIWATWLLYAVLVDLTDAVAAALN
jgi:hypothetical protein